MYPFELAHKNEIFRVKSKKIYVLYERDYKSDERYQKGAQ
jgi:hypothetical protein